MFQYGEYFGPPFRVPCNVTVPDFSFVQPPLTKSWMPLANVDEPNWADNANCCNAALFAAVPCAKRNGWACGKSCETINGNCVSETSWLFALVPPHSAADSLAGDSLGELNGWWSVHGVQITQYAVSRCSSVAYYLSCDQGGVGSKERQVIISHQIKYMYIHWADMQCSF